MLKPKPGIEATNDPDEKCQGTAATGSCYYKKVEGSDYCAMHGGQAAVRKARKEGMYEFKRTQWLQKLADDRFPVFSKGKGKYDLSEELGILRICLEETLNKCHGEQDLNRFNQKISKTIAQIQSIIESSLKLDQKLGSLVTKTEMTNIAQQLIEHIQTHVQDPNIIKAIVGDFERSLNDRFVQESTS